MNNKDCLSNWNCPAFPISEETTDRIIDGVLIFSGLTKREYFAALAMQGLLANPHDDFCELSAQGTANMAVLHGDALLTELEGK